LPPL
jgi:hypothetical protein